MLTANAWDRFMLEWKHRDKNYFISVGDRSTGETPSDVSISTHPVGASFVLRDFLTSGDAVRIKLPHLDRQPGQPQNQYLWLEHRGMTSRLERYYVQACADDRDRFPYGAPGIYAYVQVGKDLKQGPNLSGNSYDHPNFPASWIFPVTAEGNYDFEYRLDLIQAADPSLNCNWGNANVPVDRAASLPNPFTGLHDLNNLVDSNQDGVLGSGDLITGLSEVIDGQVVHNFHVSGDWEDAFGPATGKLELSLSTNPAPVPVYTHHSSGSLAPSDNRIIWLNGLSIQMSEAPGSPEDIQVDIRWDDYTVEGDVRWTGNIHLSPHDFSPGQPSLVLTPGASVVLDRGVSPTFPVARNGSFTDPTRFTALPGSYARLEAGSKLTVTAGSELVLRTGSRLVVASGARLELSTGGRLVVENGAELVIEGDGIIDVAPGGALMLANRDAGKGLILEDSGSRVEVSGNLATRDGVDLTFEGAGFLYFKSGHSVDLSPGSGVILRGTGWSDLLMRIAPDVTVSLVAVRLFLTEGKIEYGTNSRLEATGTGAGTSQILARQVRFVGSADSGISSGTLALGARNYRRVAIVRSEVRDLEHGFSLSGMPNGLPSILNDVHFENCVLAAEARNLRALNVNRVETAICLDGLRLARVGRVTVRASSLSYHGVAVDAEDVGVLDVIGGRIAQNDVGLRALRSNVDVRGGAVIESNNLGIEIHGEPDALSRLSVGESGCETAIVDNSIGILGRDVELSLDAVEHSCSDPMDCPESRIRPILFQGNDVAVGVCYSVTRNQVINVRGNYWGGGRPSFDTIRVGSSCNRPGGFLDFDDSRYFADLPDDCRLERPSLVIRPPLPRMPVSPFHEEGGD